MKFSTRLDIDVVAHESADEVALLIDLEAPSPATDVERAPATLQVVLDRSGSMAGRPLGVAVRSLVDLVAKLDARDRFGVVVFDDSAQVAVPCGPVDDKARIVEQLRAIVPGGMTDLGAGLVRGLREARRVGGNATILVISDGHTNQGVTDRDTLAGVAAQARTHGVVVSTLGLGLGYDETLLSAIARSGAGNHAFAEEPDAAGVAIAAEADGLLDKTVQAATLTIAMTPSVEMLRLYNDLPSQQAGPGLVQVEIGDLYAGEQRKLLLKLRVPAMAALGLAQVATLTLEYVELPGLLEHTVALPVSVNVVPGDEAAGRLPDKSVHVEVLFQEAQLDKLRASEALERGDRESAREALSQARTKLEQAGRDATDLDAIDVRVEYDDVTAMYGMAMTAEPAYVSKMTRASFHEGSRKRGRRDPIADLADSLAQRGIDPRLVDLLLETARGRSVTPCSGRGHALALGAARDAHAAVYVHRGRLSIALEPEMARNGALGRLAVEERNATTHYLQVPAEALNDQFMLDNIRKMLWFAFNRSETGPRRGTRSA